VETQSIELAVKVGSSLCAIIGVLIIALSHMYVAIIRRDISNIARRVESIEEKHDEFNDKVAADKVAHLEKYHLT